jgi:hypothetical protein
MTEDENEKRNKVVKPKKKYFTGSKWETEQEMQKSQ